MRSKAVPGILSVADELGTSGHPLKIGFRRLFASGQSPTGKILVGYLPAATLKSSCIGLFAHSLKIHPIEFLEIPINSSGWSFGRWATGISRFFHGAANVNKFK